MEFKSKEITAYLLKKQRPITDQRFKDGMFEHLENQPVWDPDSIYSYRPAHPGWDRVVLSREEFPELYVYKDETVRLHKLMEEKAAAEASAPAEPK